MDLFKKHPLWRKPKPHQDAETSSDHVHWIGLFHDLAHVLSIFVLGNYLSPHLGFTEFAVFTLLFMVTWFVWLDICLFNLIYISTTKTASGKK
ncbi:hypothetical protein L1D34_00035 [Vibrio mediterranei]|uniref:hypothetical protein n=1 Tax=Vibrio mediterranei TaxID=689 RepID=UPI001EFDC3C9|nr:hypothetical protein [Vibrio mediterranei]MCG9623248.1 hypothetical protein [Vibrio mediterranei]